MLKFSFCWFKKKSLSILTVHYALHCLSRSTATVIVAFAAPGEMRLLLEELSWEPSPPRQWLGSEAWVTDSDLLRFSFCAGAIGFGIQQAVIPGLRDFLLDLPLTKVSVSPVLTEFWESQFDCRLDPSEEVVPTYFFLIEHR